MPAVPEVVMEGFPDVEPPHDILVMPHALNDIGEVVAVLLWLKTQRTRYLTVYLPGKAGCDWKLLSCSTSTHHACGSKPRQRCGPRRSILASATTPSRN